MVRLLNSGLCGPGFDSYHKTPIIFNFHVYGIPPIGNGLGSTHFHLPEIFTENLKFSSHLKLEKKPSKFWGSHTRNKP